MFIRINIIYLIIYNIQSVHNIFSEIFRDTNSYTRHASTQKYGEKKKIGTEPLQSKKIKVLRLLKVLHGKTVEHPKSCN